VTEAMQEEADTTPEPPGEPPGGGRPTLKRIK
jgi:hypothetical protein